MAKANTAAAGMAKPELRKHITMARRKPLHIAFAIGGDGKAIVVMDPRKAPRAIEKQIKDEASDSKNHRFGLLRFDEDEPTVARIVVNKPSAGMAKKLVMALKGTGVRQIELVLDDGTAVESAKREDEDEDEETVESGLDGEGDGNEEGVTASADPVGPATEAETDPAMADSADPTETASDGTGDADAGATPDLGSLTRTLTALIKQMIAVIGADPTQKAALVEMATDAQSSLKRGDAQGAAAGIAVLQQALDVPTMSADTTTAAAADPTPVAPAPAATPAPAHAKEALQRYRKSRLVWAATRAKVDAELQKLSGAIVAFDTGGRFGNDIAATFMKTVDPVLSTLDDSLAGLLSQAEEAQDGDEADKALEQARATIGQYQQFASSSPLIKQLDGNPFHPMAIGKTLNASLSALAASIR